jgi:HAD superfamily hydrolase (TIGR01509 family)
MNNIRAIVFDFDGLIVDTETADYLSWKETYEAHGVELPLVAWQAAIGSLNLFDPYRYLEEEVGRTLDQEAVQAQRRARDDVLLAETAVLPGVIAYLDEAERLGLRVAIASSSPRIWLETHLTRLNLRHRFPILRGSDDVGGRAKPDPAVYRAALQALGITGAEALALEDSPNGARAAVQAGLWCVAVPNGMTRGLDFGEVAYRLTALTDMSLAQLITEVTGYAV